MTDTKERKQMEERCQPGDTVRIIRLVNEEQRIGPGSVGVVDHIDDAGQVHVRWECGSSVALLLDDDFEVLRDFTITVGVEGFVDVTVKATSVDEASRVACETVGEMDFGRLRDIQLGGRIRK